MSHQNPFPTMTPAASAEFNRRGFLDALLAVGFVSTAVAIAYPVSRFLIPPASGEPATASAVAGEGRGAQAEQRRGFSSSAAGRASSSARPTATSARSAPSARTSTARCSSRPTPRSSGAPATTALYDLGGNVVSGPPPRALEKFVVNLRGEPGDEEIVVSRG